MTRIMHLQVTDPVEVLIDESSKTLKAIRHHGRMFLVGQVVLGWQLSSLKNLLGLGPGGNRRRSLDAEAAHSWAEVVSENFGLAPRTARRFESIYEAAQVRARSIGEPRLAAILGMPYQDVTGELGGEIDKLIHKITDGETQRSLLDEFIALKKGGANPPTKQAGEAAPEIEYEQYELAIDWFRPSDSALKSKFLTEQGRRFIYELPLRGERDDAELTLDELLEDLRDALQIAEEVAVARRAGMTQTGGPSDA